MLEFLMLKQRWNYLFVAVLASFTVVAMAETGVAVSVAAPNSRSVPAPQASPKPAIVPSPLVIHGLKDPRQQNQSSGKGTFTSQERSSGLQLFPPTSFNGIIILAAMGHLGVRLMGYLGHWLIYGLKRSLGITNRRKPSLWFWFFTGWSGSGGSSDSNSSDSGDYDSGGDDSW